MAGHPDRRLALWIGRLVAHLHPGSFALVMATGVISTAMRLVGRAEISDALFAFNAAAYVWLWLLAVARIVRHPRRVWADLADPRTVFAFFAIVAATDVLAAGLGLRGAFSATAALWTAALIIWLGLVYFAFGVLIVANRGDGADVVRGGWLLAIVGAESLVTAGALVAPLAGNLREAVFVLIHMLWGVGIGLYGVFVTLFAYRIFFFHVRPDDTEPQLWVVMGAAAISANAGSTLLLGDPGMPFLAAMRPFIDGVTLLMWAWGSWWIPLLVLLGVWKHVVQRHPLAYTPMLWSLVFPLGMYALASLRLSLASAFPPLRLVADGMVWVALAAWAATAAGLLAATWRDLRAAAPAGAT